MKMRIIALLLPLLVTGCDACGNSSLNNELVGQPKRLHNVTPLLCEDRVDLDVSMGFMKDGVGSVSTQDMKLTVPDKKNSDLLTKAINENKLVKLHYNVARVTWCWNDHVVTEVEVLENKP